mmetsp:Transcript_107602/g.321788  ORF Transcript_107602/g.321788 Transcript_107602/m.321788 type:complete len:310 (-) Transcript_107602:409-1338(-)
MTAASEAKRPSPGFPPDAFGAALGRGRTMGRTLPSQSSVGMPYMSCRRRPNSFMKWSCARKRWRSDPQTAPLQDRTQRLPLRSDANTESMSQSMYTLSAGAVTFLKSMGSPSVLTASSASHGTGWEAKQFHLPSQTSATCVERSSVSRGGTGSECTSPSTKLSSNRSKSSSSSAEAFALDPGFETALDSFVGSWIRSLQKASLPGTADLAAHRMSGGHSLNAAPRGSAGASTAPNVSPASRLSQTSWCASVETPPPVTSVKGLPGTTAQAMSARGPKGAFALIRCHVRHIVSEAHTSAWRPVGPWPPTT